MVAEAGNRLVAEDEEFIHLPQELKEIEEQLNRAKSESVKNARAAKEAEQRKNDLIVYLAHDLKTPLTSVIGYLSLLRDEREISEELQEKYLGVALEKAERLEDLINEFFEITRFNLTHLTLEKERVNLSRMLEQIVFEFRPMFLEKDIAYETEIEPGLSIVCDVDKMERVFDNVLKNAVNYTPEGGKIRVAAGKEAESVAITFWNTGRTIPKEKLERIFEQFFRLDSARGSRSGGAGLGLAIAKEIVELHEGRIWAVSEEGTVEFKVEIPAGEKGD
jgi:two-component system sensor histidine kinase VanS